MLGVLESPAPDPNDRATRTCTPPPGRDYTKFLTAGGLKGARIGIPRAFYFDKITLPGQEQPRGGLNPDQAKLLAEAIAILKQQGAVIVDPADIPSFVDKDPQNNFLLWDYCSLADQAKGKDANCSVNFKYGMKRDFNHWLASLGASAPVKTLFELRQWNLSHVKAGAMKYGQSRLDISDEMDLEADRARNEADHRKDLLLSRSNGIDAVLKANRLDAILTPGGSGAGLAAGPDTRSSLFHSGWRRMHRSRRFRLDSMRDLRRSVWASQERPAASHASSKSPSRLSARRNAVYHRLPRPEYGHELQQRSGRMSRNGYTTDKGAASTA